MFLETTDGKKIFYETYGSRSSVPLLLLHGIGADHNMWEPQIHTYPEQGFFLIVPDLRGHGKSDKVDSLSMKDWSRDLAELMDELGIKKTAVAGVSMGGIIAQHFALHYPDRIERLVLSDTFSELRTFNEKMMGASQTMGFKLFKMLGHQQFAKMMASAYKKPFATKARDYFFDVSLKADFHQLILARKVINRIHLLDQLKNITAPALVMAGKEFGNQLINMNQEIARRIPTARFKALDQAMDPSNLVNPDSFDHEVITFLKEGWDENED